MDADGMADTIVEGLPVHPLYVHLAAALYRWIRGMHFPRNLAPIAGINEDESWRSRLDAWTNTVVTEGSALLEVIHLARHHEVAQFFSLRQALECSLCIA